MMSSLVDSLLLLARTKAKQNGLPGQHPEGRPETTATIS
jgi:hypothetical protein